MVFTSFFPNAQRVLDWPRWNLKALVEITRTRPERVFLIGVEAKSRDASDLTESLDELSRLVTTAGGEVVGNGRQRLEAPVSGSYIGAGKAEEFAAECRRSDVDTVVFDDEQKKSLAAFRRFRHVIHHGYILQLDWERMAEGVGDIGTAYTGFKAKLHVLFGV